MAYKFLYKGIIFIEGDEPRATIIAPIKYNKLFSFNSQLQTLDCVKNQLVEQTLSCGGNAVVNFEYGQKSSGWLASSLFALDDNIKWYGSGMAAKLPEGIKNQIIEELTNK